MYQASENLARLILKEGEIMFCIKCGAEIQEGTRFCIHCGTPVAEIPASESPKAESIDAESPKKEGPIAAGPESETPRAETPKAETPKAETPKAETPKTETPKTEILKTEISETKIPKTEMPETEIPKAEIPEEAPGRTESSEADSIVIKIPKIKIPKVDNPAISETGEKVKELGKKYLKEGVDSVQKAYQYGSEQIKSGSITIPRPKMSKKKLSMIGGIVLLIVVIAVISSLFKGSGSGFSSPEKAYDAWNRGYYLHDFDLALKAWPDFDIEYQGGEAGVRAALQSWYDDEELGELLTEYDTAYLYEAVGHTKLSKSEVEQISQKIADFYGKDIKISDVALIERQFVTIINGDENPSKNEPEEETYGYAVKYEGKWYYLTFF